VDRLSVKAALLKELGNKMRAGQADELHSKYGPKPAPAVTPEPASADADGDVDLAGLDDDTLARLTGEPDADVDPDIFKNAMRAAGGE
jgi:hypothetical protein